jgi:hypothetical protein
MDFTLEKYGKILESIKKSNYRVYTVEDYLKREINDYEDLIIIRHDIDARPQRALKMATMEEKYGVKATYYFRTVSEVFDKNIISEIHGQGHEIGYHYEALDTAKGNIGKALDIIKSDLVEFNKICEIKTMCMHGNSLTKWDNRDLWKFDNFTDFGILGEAYLSIDFENLIYISDSSRSWEKKYKIKDIWHNMNMLEVKDSDHLANIIEIKRYNIIYLLIHPDQWSNNKFENFIDSIYYCTTNPLKLLYRGASQKIDKNSTSRY